MATEDIFENAEFYMVPPTRTIVNSVDVIEENKVQELNLTPTDDKLPILDLNMLGPDWEKDAVVTTNVETTPTTTTTSTNAASNNAYKALADELAEKYNITITDENKFESGDDVVAFFNAELDKKIKEGIDNKLNSIGPKAKLYMELNEYIGDDEKTIAVIEDLNYYNSLTSDDINSNADLQKDLITNMLQIRGFSKEKIEEELTDIEALSKLDSKAIEAKEFLIKAGEGFINSSKEKKLLETTKSQEEFSKMLDSLDKLEEISGIKVTKELQAKIKESISKPVFVDKAGKTYNDIANKQRLYKNEFEKAVNFVNVLGLLSFNKDGSWNPDFSKLSTLTTKKIAKKLDEAIAESQRFSKVGGESTPGSLADILSQL